MCVVLLGIGPMCVQDRDGDGIPNDMDNCVEFPNPDQEDDDEDSIGNVCDNCTDHVNPNQADEDFDGLGDVCDNCVDIFNPEQKDQDRDGFGTDCDCSDEDNSIHPNAQERCDGVDNNCDGNVDEAQVCHTTWQHTYGMDNWGDGRDLLEMAGGGYAVFGRYNIGAGDENFWLLLLNEDGTIRSEWWYGEEFANDIACSFTQTDDNGFIMVGYTIFPGEGYWQALVLKVDALGVPQWDYVYDSPHASRFQSVRQTTDGGFILGGHIDNQNDEASMWLLRLDQDGNEIWSKEFRDGSFAQALDVHETDDGGFISVGDIKRF